VRGVIAVVLVLIVVLVAHDQVPVQDGRNQRNGVKDTQGKVNN
jgi:hypothetical protein